MGKKPLLYIVAFVVSACLFLRCQKAVIPELVYVQEEVPEVPLVLPAEVSDSLYRGLRNLRAVVDFYRSQDWRPAWAVSERSMALADSLIRFVRNIRHFGLLPQAYHVEALSTENRLWWRPEVQLRRDALLTDAFIALAKDLRHGYSPGDSVDDSQVVHLLRDVLVNGGIAKALEGRQPDFPQYRLLRASLEKMIEGADSSGRSLLMQGVTVDSLPLHRKVKTIEVNLERWRRELSPWGNRYILVNIPAFKVELVEDDKVILTSRAIVGKPENPTRVLSSTIQCFITYPYWHVPRKIAVEEFLPVIQRDTSFIRRNQFDVLDRRGKILRPDSLDWNSFHKNNFPVMLRQREGPENSLGIIKFVFDNPYAIFLHDTNAPRLFRLEKRALSHGCIRVEKAEALAHYLVTGKLDKRSSLLDGYLEQKRRHTIDLSRPIPIHIRYFTAVVDREGEVVFLDDIYYQDCRD